MMLIVILIACESISLHFKFHFHVELQDFSINFIKSCHTNLKHDTKVNKIPFPASQNRGNRQDQGSENFLLALKMVR